MKSLFAVLLVAVLCPGSFTGRISLCLNNKPEFSILTGTNPDSLTYAAAVKLKTFLGRITSVNFSIDTVATENVKYICVGRKAIKESPELERIKTLGREGFIISTGSGRIILAGKNGTADLNAVYTFLEEYLGCIRFTGSEEYIPVNSSIAVPASDRIYEPAFSFRHPHFMDRQNPDFLSWHKLSSFRDWGLFVHTFQRLCPPEKYFDLHPEYFSLVSGKRIRDGQLCLSNPAVIKLLGDNLEALMLQEPGKKWWSVSQNDCINYCECKDCRKLYKKYGNISGLYVEMANRLAERFPDKQISTLAYQFTRQAPVNIAPHPNVNIMFCSIECNRSMPLETDPRSADFVADMIAWDKLTDNIFMWDYVVQFKTYLCPFPNFHVLQPNIEFFRKHNVSMMFQQGSGSGWSDLCEMKQYLIAKLLWNPSIDADSVIERFAAMYYGPAARYILKYHRTVEKEMVKHQDKWTLDIYGLPSFYFRTYLTGRALTEYYKWMDMAEESVSSDSVYLKRVLKTRCSVDFALIDYALNSGDPEISFTMYRDGHKELNGEITGILDRFIENCELSGITNIGEEKLTITEYHEHIKTILSLSLTENKAEGKSVRSLTSFHPRYSDPGVAGLTDGIFGGRHFNSGWLGYEGEDMIVEIDLGASEKISRVSMNFLRDFVSWIFLPDDVKVEISQDGRSFHEAGKVSNTITDRRFGVEPVFHKIEFKPAYARYVRITAISMKRCPEWHRGSGHPSWIFCDELIVE
jgi:hypothetical protein